MMTTQQIKIYGIPMDLGQNRRGVDMGPSAIRYAGLQSRLQRLGCQVIDSGNLTVPVVEEIDKIPLANGQAHHLNVIAEVCQHIYETAAHCIEVDERAIFLGGDHSIAIGTIAAILERPQKVGIIWVDTHADFNTPQTSPTGNVHGMVVSSLMGLGPDVLHIGKHHLQTEQIVMIGIRDLDSEERVALRESGIKVQTMRDIDEHGMAAIVQDALNYLGDVDVIHVSFDMDSLDPSVAGGVGTPVPGGLSYREAHLLMEMLADDGRVQSLDVVEVNPILDEHNHTAEVAVDMIASLFGQRII
ncbi:MAG: arginase [Chloroflexi bacterium]|nr:MAG: arginase [Chloroflexota bacterium]